jgi:hypothetical protein
MMVVAQAACSTIKLKTTSPAFSARSGKDVAAEQYWMWAPMTLREYGQPAPQAEMTGPCGSRDIIGCGEDHCSA